MENKILQSLKRSAQRVSSNVKSVRALPQSGTLMDTKTKRTPEPRAAHSRRRQK